MNAPGRAAASTFAAWVIAFAPVGYALADEPHVFAHGHLFSLARGFVVFTSGDAVRVRPGTPAPGGTTLGSSVRVEIDPADGAVVAIEAAPHGALPNEIDVRDLPRAFVAASERSTVRASATPPASAGSVRDGAGEPGSVTLVVDVPANTPLGDDVYLATDRSNFGPAEVRMTRTSSRRFTVTLGLPHATKLHYQYTRGSYATVERDRIGGIVAPRELEIAPGAAREDRVDRWADLN